MKLVNLEKIWTPQARQHIFRALLEATAYPGRVFDLSDALDGARAELGILSCLADDETTVADEESRLNERERRLLNTYFTPVNEAAFVLCDARVAPSGEFAPRIGTIYRPDLGATLILSCVSVGAGGTELTLTGPGIETVNRLYLDGISSEWLVRRKTWTADFPQGVDLLLCDEKRVAAIPRTTMLEIR